jgi:hypothetical protein
MRRERERLRERDRERRKFMEVFGCDSLSCWNLVCPSGSWQLYDEMG